MPRRCRRSTACSSCSPTRSRRSVAGGTRRNRAHAEEFTTFDRGVPEARRWLVCDAMTSGGLLAAVPPERRGRDAGLVIGRLAEGAPGTIVGSLSGR